MSSSRDFDRFSEPELSAAIDILEGEIARLSETVEAMKDAREHKINLRLYADQ